jgi:hypothetical protein
VAYACPVCDAVEADGEHLANHLAITAIRGDDDHADWLEKHAPDWDEEDPPGLAERVTPLAETVEVEGTTHDHDRPPAPSGGGTVGGAAKGGNRGPAADEATREALESARDLTERMLADEADAADGDDED